MISGCAATISPGPIQLGKSPAPRTIFSPGLSGCELISLSQAESLTGGVQLQLNGAPSGEGCNFGVSLNANPPDHITAVEVTFESAQGDTGAALQADVVGLAGSEGLSGGLVSTYPGLGVPAGIDVYNREVILAFAKDNTIVIFDVASAKRSGVELEPLMKPFALRAISKL